MTVFHRRTFLRAGAGLLGATALATPALRSAQAAETGNLVLYNGQHRTTTEALVAAFTKATGINVTVRNGESPQLASQLLEEGSHSPADLFYSEQAPPIAAVSEKGLLAPINPATLKQIPTAYVAKDGTWIGGSVRTRVVGYNKAMIGEDKLPNSVLDFATPAWKDRVAYVPHDGFQEQVVAILLLKGHQTALDWLKGLKQYGRMYNSNGAAMRAVEAGEIATVLTNNYYWYSLSREAGARGMKSALHAVERTDPGALHTVSAAGLLKTSRRPEQAQRFLDFLVSEAGQTAIVNSVAEYPVRDGIVSPFPLPPITDFAAPVTAAQIGTAAQAYQLQRDAGIA